MKRPAAFLPVALFALAALGMLWADVPFKERIKGIDSFLKLLTIPLLMIQFRRSDRAIWALAAFLASGTLAARGVRPDLAVAGGSAGALAKGYGLPVKDYIAQSAVFTICAFGLFYLAVDAFRLRWQILRRWSSFVLGVLFLADMFFVITSRTALLTLPFLLLLSRIPAIRLERNRGCAVSSAVSRAAVWASRRMFVTGSADLAMEIKRQQTENIETPAGARIDFWKRSIEVDLRGADDRTRHRLDPRNVQEVRDRRGRLGGGAGQSA